MNLCLLAFTDGRAEFLKQTLDSFRDNIKHPLHTAIIVNDHPDDKYARWLTDTFPWARVVTNNMKLGFTGTIANAWKFHVPANSNYVFHLEDDFTFNHYISIEMMAFLLERNPMLAQVALKRQPVNPEEEAVGGFMQQRPGQYHNRETESVEWVEHRVNFTTNPCLYRRSLCRRGWPAGYGSERIFSDMILADPDASFGFLGTVDSPPSVHHIGSYRMGMGY